MDLSFLNDWDTRIKRMESALEKIAESKSASLPQEVKYDMEGVLEYLPYPMAKSTLYEKLRRGEFPAHKNGKYWYFFKSEVDAFLLKGKRRSNTDISDELDNLLSSKK
ncbi:MAG: helix-turn-helix domain-containing protein [Arenibacter algicola]